MIEISEPTIIHDPSNNPMKPQGLKIVKYDCIVITKLNIRKHIKHIQIITFWSGLYETSKDTYR